MPRADSLSRSSCLIVSKNLQPPAPMFFFKPGIDGGHIVGRDVAAPGCLLQLGDHLLRLGALARYGLCHRP